MAQTHECRDNENLDAICYEHYGSVDYLVNVLNANPTLTQYGVHLPAGLIITLPEVDTRTNVAESVQLWS